MEQDKRGLLLLTLAVISPITGQFRAIKARSKTDPSKDVSFIVFFFALIICRNRHLSADVPVLSRIDLRRHRENRFKEKWKRTFRFQDGMKWSMQVVCLMASTEEEGKSFFFVGRGRGFCSSQRRAVGSAVGGQVRSLLQQIKGNCRRGSQSKQTRPPRIFIVCLFPVDDDDDVVRGSRPI